MWKTKRKDHCRCSKQCNMFTKAKVSSPALSLEGILATLVIDAHKKRHVEIADVTGVFLEADMDDFVVVKLQGRAVDALLNANKEKYCKYVFINPSRKVLYVTLLKAMYGMLKALLLC